VIELDAVLQKVRQYYDEKLAKYGPIPSGVDWNSFESQTMRFEQLLRILDGSSSFSINDYGCGYGALVDYIVNKGYSFHYRGFDISDRMITKARELHKELRNCEFSTDETRLRRADYTIASGIFNVKLDTDAKKWENYVIRTVRTIARLSEKGFAFNALTKYSDRDRMRSDLYYADPLLLFDYCKRNFSRFVALLHDYPLYEFTILVRM
jgi:SAM-dependent methyltransferase